jgi:hypothetical protein
MTPPEEEIDDYQFKQLLQDVEDTGLPRDEVNFLGICNNDPRLYGRKGSDQRRAFQFKWNYIKKWDIHRYIELLDSKVIGPNVANEALLRQSEPESQRPATTKNVKKNRQKNRDDDEEEEEDGGGVEESIDEVAARLAGLAMSDDDDDDDADDEDEDDDGVDGQGLKPRWKAAMSTPPRATRPRWSTRTPDHLSSPSLKPRAVYQRDVSPFPAGESEVTSGGGDGTRRNPYVVKVDPNHPERHFVFDIERVVNMVHDAHEYNGYHVRVSIACPDFEIWEAMIPATSSLPKKYRDFAKRAIVIKGPARSYWLSDVAMYHSKLTKEGADCPETKRRHTHTALAISKDPPRKDAYWLLLWPKGTVLDNQILSNKATELKKGILGMDVDALTNPLGKHLYGMAIYWRIAEMYGGSQVEDNATKVDATKLFD